MLAHELAHLFTEPFGSGPLRLSMQRGVGVNMGLVEGIASAAEWSAEDFDPHEATAAMRRLGIAPDLRRIFGASGFWTQASGAAYTSMGSFVRYLVDYWGMESFQVAYGRGDFEGAYGRAVEELIQEWEEYLDGLVLTERQEEVARFRYDRPSIFGRVCARALAEERRLARNEQRRGALSSARRRWERVLHAEPMNPSNHLEYAGVLGRMEEFSLALEATAARPEGLSLVQQAQFLELEGDLLWRMGEEEGARRAYEEALELGVPVATERGLWMKKRLVAQGSSEGRILLVESSDATWATFLMTRWRYEEPESVEAAYLLGRRLWQSRRYEEAVAHLRAAQGALGVEVLDGEAALMLGHSLFALGDDEEAREVFTALEASSVTRYREGARLWLARLDWKGAAVQDVAE